MKIMKQFSDANGEDMNKSELRNVEIRILNEITQFCDNNGIQYYLYYGTLLGAIRHKGFIPWDDDIDICMLREDYERFVHLFKETETLALVTTDTNPMYYMTAAKVYDKTTLLIENIDKPLEIGANIDVFAIDNVPDNTKEKKTLLKKISLLRKILSVKNIKNTPDRKLYKRLILFFGKIALVLFQKNKIITLIKSIASSYSEINTTSIANLELFTYGEKEIIPRGCFNSPIKMKFEDGYYYVPGDYNSVLKCLYGDYMKLPPESKRHTHHEFIVRWK